MNRSETAMLLALAAARDRRTVGDADVMAWAQDLADIDFTDAQAALGQHYRTSAAWLMPAHIRALVRVIRAERRRGSSEALALPSRFEDDVVRAATIRRGVALCRSALAGRSPAPAELPAEPTSRSEAVRTAALRQAAAGHAEHHRRTDPAPLSRLAGQTLHTIRTHEGSRP